MSMAFPMVTYLRPRRGIFRHPVMRLSTTIPVRVSSDFTVPCMRLSTISRMGILSPHDIVTVVSP